MKQLISPLTVFILSLVDSEMSIDSHNYTFIRDYLICTFELSTAYMADDFSNLTLNVIDLFM